MMSLYPFKFRPRFVEKMWGGRKLQTALGKPLPAGKSIGESWELFDFPPGVVEKSTEWVSSEIANGPLAGRTLHWAVGEFAAELHGKVPLSGPHKQFPILIKFLDAREDLSVQVHPDRAYADSNPHAHLKTEAWYVLQNDPEARLLMGLKPGVTREQFEKGIQTGDVEQLIEAVKAREGECFFLPSGTVHALGAGLLVAEVQTPSDTTFRVFDFDRVDPSTGKRRDLHIEQALQCIDFSTPAEPSPAEGSRLVTCPYFHIEKRHLHPGNSRRVNDGEPTVLIVTHGTFDLRANGVSEILTAARGEVVLIPAAIARPTIETTAGCGWLEVTFPC
ncbi:MAG TPA: type I phosphomannose isomerase catalytic subunit [Tepidisphaeraceae bacterium]|nr:type I phosphomannose isomerase catalytic subunit [Tepidisphaeraceae bacterium]